MASPASRLPRTAIFFAAYGMLAALSLWFAYELRFVGADEPTTAEHLAFESYLNEQRPYALLWLVPLKVCLLAFWGQFRGVFYYFRLPDALRTPSPSRRRPSRRSPCRISREASHPVTRSACRAASR